MPTYEYACPACEAHHERKRPANEVNAPVPCPVCAAPARRVWTVPKLLFTADPRDVRPVWHNHDGYSHQHAPRRGRHRHPSEDH